MKELNEKTEFYHKIDMYHWNKPGKKPYRAEKIQTIVVETNDAKLT